MAALYRLNPPADLVSLCGVRDNPDRRKLDGPAQVTIVEKPSGEKVAVDAAGKERYSSKPAVSLPIVPIALAAVLGLLVIRKVRS